MVYQNALCRAGKSNVFSLPGTLQHPAARVSMPMDVSTQETTCTPAISTGWLWPKLINFALPGPSEAMHILIVDNYDSFTYNLYHIIEAVMPESCRLTVRRNDGISLREARKYDRYVISPGPGLPADAGISCELIRAYAGEKSILGICLGHQAIAEVFGGTLINLDSVLHGKAIKTSVTQPGEPLFAGCPEHFETGRYHSWAVDPDSLPPELVTTAVDDLGLIMAISHQNLDVRGLQFHPESVMTGTGRQILKNWVEFSR